MKPINTVKEIKLEEKRAFPIPPFQRGLILMSYFTLILTSALIAYLFYLSLWPMEIVRLKDFHMESNLVKRGEMFSYYLDFEKLKDYKSETRYYLVDGIIIRLEEKGVQRKPSTYKIISSRQTPKTINPGIYKMRIELDYRILPWRTITYVWESNQFKIL